MFEIPADWEWSSARMLAAPAKYSCIGGPFGSRLTQSDYVSEPGVPVIRGVNLSASPRFVDENFAYVSEVKAAGLASHTAFPGDIVFTQRGTLGQVARIPDNPAFPRYVLSQSQMKLTVDESQADPAFVYHYFRSPAAMDYVQRSAITTGVPHINLAILRGFPVPKPPLHEQRAISAILGSLDDKIELNRRTNQTLEAIAQTLFRAWFVSFDDDADLVDSELGPIPRGWKIEALPDVIEVNPRRRLRKGCEAPFVEMKDLPTNEARIGSWRPREFTSGSRFLNGDVLLARITPCLENGKTAFVDFLQPDETGWGSTEFLVLRSKPPLPVEYAYFLARSPEFRQFAIANMTGSSGRQRVRTQALAHYRLPIPPTPLAERFGAFARVVFQSLKARDDESRTLAELRDTLLPKLISGEIRVPEAERLVEEAV